MIPRDYYIIVASFLKPSGLGTTTSLQVGGVIMLCHTILTCSLNNDVLYCAVMAVTLSLATASAFAMLAREFHFGMTDSIMPRECIRSTEGLLLRAKVTSNLLLLRVVYCVLMSSKIVWPRENGVAGFPGTGIYPFALVRARLGVENGRCPATVCSSRPS